MKIKGKMKSDIKVECLGRWKGKKKEKGWKKCKCWTKWVQFDEHNKKLHFLFFKTKREREREREYK